MYTMRSGNPDDEYGIIACRVGNLTVRQRFTGMSLESYTVLCDEGKRLIVASSYANLPIRRLKSWAKGALRRLKTQRENKIAHLQTLMGDASTERAYFERYLKDIEAQEASR